MGLITRIGMLVKSNLNAIVAKAEDPAKILKQSINDMQRDLVKLRQAVMRSISLLKLQEEQYKESATQAQEWEKRAILAIQKGEENLAREALSYNKTHADSAATLKAGLDQQSRQVETLKKDLIAIESKVAEAKTEKEILKVRKDLAATLKAGLDQQSVQVETLKKNLIAIESKARTKREMLKAQFLQEKNQEYLNNMLGKVNTNSAATTVECVEESFRRLEDRARLQEVLLASASSEDDLESKFIKLEAGSEIEDKNAALKAKVLSSSPAPQGALPPSDVAKPSVKATIADEIESLRRQLG
ncbi:PspA/IM30 family protein [Pseudanabaena minima]|uniref:PspA/IM30 family protein n=1 Tax=Pseudanabaena minima TaxID=890415 RepID=UPI003DA935DE